MESTEQPRTETREMECLHCGERHDVQVITEPGWEPVKYCNRTGVAG